ncbi:putative GPI-anchored cupredoxin [Ceratocystis lukuohia]|uniref:GPI-anchored cupredoxin n=1 Tax=Ceratocystis lukuohia TaxID=2019550 RepID=A0ABR4MHF6_9PEZI
MRFTITALLAATAAMAIPPATPEDSTSQVAKRAGTTHIIWVGNTIYPNNIQAEAGDKVQFHFLPGVHSVIQSSYTDPCKSNGGFGSTTRVTYDYQRENEYFFEIDIMSSKKRIWYYNGAGDACMKGAVGAINSPENRKRNLDHYREAAKVERYAENVPEVQGGRLVPV